LSRPILLDTSVYVELFRQPDAFDMRSITQGGDLWLSAVVLEELYAGAGYKEVQVIELLERSFAADSRLLVPSLEDWKQAGLVLARLAARYGFEQIGRGRLTNDALIAISAGRCGASLLTLNRQDFTRLAEFWQFDWQAVSLGRS
jgi:predicted nucleic acid-binding protein